MNLVAIKELFVDMENLCVKILFVEKIVLNNHNFIL